jgi:hypothetical protein
MELTCSGVHDPRTSAIHIALGLTLLMDAASFRLLKAVPNAGSALDLSGTFIGFSSLMSGFLAQSIETMLNQDQVLRKWFGPFRYFVLPIVWIFNRKRIAKLKFRYVAS